jgi:hypothetical protein
MVAYAPIDALEKYFAVAGPGAGRSEVSLMCNEDLTRRVRVATTIVLSVEQL